MLTIVQAHVGRPTLLGMRRGREVYSSIVRQRIEAPFIDVDVLGMVGNEQADTRVIRDKRVHGGPLKAIYAYPLEHLAEWDAELEVGVSPGVSFGENLTVLGAVETDVCIGDQYRCGDVVLRVTSPRRPCYKLGMHLGEDVPRLMVQNGRCGWYFEVMASGSLPTTGAVLERISRLPDAQTVAAAFAAKTEADPSIPDMPQEE